MSKIAQDTSTLDKPAAADQLTRTARASAETVARTSSETAAQASREFTRTATPIADNQQAAARNTAAEANDIGRTVAELLAEQTRHGVDAAAAMRGAVDWAQLAEAQRDFITGSFDRMRQFNERYREAVLSSLKSFAATARR